MKLSRLFVAVSFAFLIGGCAVGPNYHRPDVAMPAEWKELPGWTQASPDADGPKGDWWVGFNDPLLNELEPLVSVSNQTVRQNYANYQQALAQVQVARGALFPTIGVTSAVANQRSAQSSLGTSLGNLGNVSRINNSGSLEGNISWNLDLWGQVRRTLEQNAATAQASQATYANATLSAQAALATAVINLRVADANIDLLTRTVDAYKEYLRVVTEQDRAGTVPPSNLIMARTQLEGAQSSLIALGVARSQYAHAIAVLVGKNPEDLDIAHSTALPTLPEVPSVVPSTLLQRRPDIAIAERQMAAANAQIGVAKAAWYPAISLSALDGFSQSPLSGLLRVANYVWSLGANATETLIDGGQRSGQVSAARAGYDAAVAGYRATVLGALQNVEDDLSGLRILAQQADVLNAAVADATRGADIAKNEYEAGTVDYTTVATALATQLSNQQNALSVQQQRLLNTVSLIGDLGGGWSASELCNPSWGRCAKKVK